ncbi:MAG: hypothetical protein HY720_22290 [Planctomycetes bacterium]|nr:hypothetical protein [Planctomycetota bacterium]
MKAEAIGQGRLGDFLDLSLSLHAGDPEWIPPLRAPLLRELAGLDAFGRYGTIQAFLCEKDGRPAGRVAALLNSRLRDASGAVLGQVGYFECADDERVAGALLESAFAWLRERGAREAWGPMNGGAHRTHRLLSRGFERSPFLFEPRNPPYYPRLFENHGFRRIHTWRGFDLPAPAFRAAVLENRGLDLAVRRAGKRYRVDHPDPGTPGSTLPRMHVLLDRVWAGHVGYSSLDLGEFTEIFGPVLALLDPWHVFILVDGEDGRDVGCAFAYPDYSAEVRQLSGDASGWGSWLGRGERPRRLVMHTVALVPEARGSGAVYLALVEAVERLVQDGYEEAQVALVTEDWRFFETTFAPTREYALYARSLV